MPINSDGHVMHKNEPVLQWVAVYKPDLVTYELVRYDRFVGQLLKKQIAPLMHLHCALGVCGEAGELADAIKKEHIYNKPTDLANIIEELGDLRFYMQAVMNLYGIDEREVLQGNANKLGKRYSGLVYTDEAAQLRADKIAVEQIRTEYWENKETVDRLIAEAEVKYPEA